MSETSPVRFSVRFPNGDLFANRDGFTRFSELAARIIAQSIGGTIFEPGCEAEPFTSLSYPLPDERKPTWDVECAHERCRCVIGRYPSEARAVLEAARHEFRHTVRYMQ